VFVIVFGLSHIGVNLLNRNTTADLHQIADEAFLFGQENSPLKRPVLSQDAEISSLVASVSLNEDLQKKEQVKVLSETVLAKKTFKYKVKRGETLDKIARKFGLKTKDILAYNPKLLNSNLLKAGSTINLPPGTRVQGIVTAPTRPVAEAIKGVFVEALTELGDWITPVSGFNQRNLHSHNGVDVSAECGQPVYAAQDGLVITSSNNYDGYGEKIEIQHEDGSVTLYGHLSQRGVDEGTYVSKGSLIGFVGNTGKVRGITGCHLHFERRGGPNPLLQKK
jgi:LysM repeat protein